MKPQIVILVVEERIIAEFIKDKMIVMSVEDRKIVVFEKGIGPI